jgi:hypothetical protein
MTSTLPRDYFSSLSLSRYGRFPVDYFQSFIECLPCTSQSLSLGSLRTRLEFDCGITNEELQSILSHELLRDARLEFRDFELPLNEINDTLRNCQNLCSFVAPVNLVQNDNAGESFADNAGESFAANENLQFLELSPVTSTSEVPLKLLKAISDNPSIQELKISFYLWTVVGDLDQISVKLRYFLSEVCGDAVR